MIQKSTFAFYTFEIMTIMLRKILLMMEACFVLKQTRIVLKFSVMQTIRLAVVYFRLPNFKLTNKI